MTTSGTAAPPEVPTGDRPPPLPQLVVELRELLVAYFQQETVVPLKQLGRYVGFGLAGALALGLGVMFLAVAGLRALQTETDTALTGNWSWAPYAIMVAVLLIGAVITWKARGAVRRRKDAV
jgi:hypothetical protein